MRIGVAAMGSRLSSSGGTAVYTHNLVEALADYDQRHTYVVLVNENDVNVWTYRQWPVHMRFVPLRAVEPRQPLVVRAWRRLRHILGLPVPPRYGEPYLARQIDALGLDLIHFPRTIVYPLSVKTLCVLTFFDLQQEYYPEFFTQAELEARARTYKPSVEKARHVIVPSNYTRQSLIDKYNVSDDKMSLVPVGLPDGFHRASVVEVDGVKSKYQLPDQFVLYPANPWPHKNHARLMAALRIYQNRYGQVPPLVLSGRLSNERRDATLLAVAAGVEDQIIDLGFVPQEDLPSLYSAATMMVFPSLFEGFGIPLVEAMACGCPIAAANATAIPECVNGAALLFDPFDPGAIVDAIHRLLGDQVLRESLVKQGYQQLGRYDWKTIVPRLVSIYEQATNGPHALSNPE
jgi:glycosyltransferase involved in cell wall biosynthesis